MSINLNPIVPAHTKELFNRVSNAILDDQSVPETPFVILDKQWELQYFTIETKGDGDFIIGFKGLVQQFHCQDVVFKAMDEVHKEIKAERWQQYKVDPYVPSTTTHVFHSSGDHYSKPFTLEGESVTEPRPEPTQGHYFFNDGKWQFSQKI